MLLIEQVGPRLNVTLNRPEVRNAIDDALIALLTKTFREVPSDVRAVILRGEGKGFCAGGDLEWMRRAANYTEQQNYDDAVKLGELFLAIANCPAVVISAVHGAAFGGGCGLVAASDVAICTQDALFAFSEVRLGLIPGTISMVVLPKIGAGHARALFTTGEAFGAEKALRIGLVHEIAPLEEMDSAIAAKLKAIFAAGPKAVHMAKKAVHDFPFSLEEAASRLAKARSSDEGMEGVAAFLEKRKPSYFFE